VKNAEANHLIYQHDERDDEQSGAPVQRERAQRGKGAQRGCACEAEACSHARGGANVASQSGCLQSAAYSVFCMIASASIL
jgi:hypothetical protein